jgi:hypothetical protein
MPLDSCCAAARFGADGRFLWADFVRDVDLERHGFTQPDSLSNGPRKDADSRNTGFPSRNR